MEEEELPGRATLAEAEGLGTRPAARTSITVPPPQHWFSPRRPETNEEEHVRGPFHWPNGGGLTGERVWSPGQQAGVHLHDWGRGGPRSITPPDAHIRAQEGVGPALSRGPEPGTGSPGICQVPGRARAPGWLVPTSLAAAPGAPTADWLGPTQLLWGRVLPGRPSPAGPRLPAGLGRTSPPARRGAEGRASASRRPGAWAGWHDWMPPPSGGVPFLSARRSGAPPP